MFDYFAVEVATVLEDYGLGVRHEAPFFSVVTDNVGSLLSRLYHDGRFSHAERNTISLVVLGREDSFDGSGTCSDMWDEIEPFAFQTHHKISSDWDL